jgi:hypothetical protein
MMSYYGKPRLLFTLSREGSQRKTLREEEGLFQQDKGQIRGSTDWYMTGMKAASRLKGSRCPRVSGLVGGPPEGGRARVEEID